VILLYKETAMKSNIVERYLLLNIFFLLFIVRGEAQPYQQYSAGMELSNLHVQDIAQDSLGYIWMATARGLDRLDGYDQPYFFLNKSDNVSLSNDNVCKLFVSRCGYLYVFTRWGINIYNRSGGNFMRLKDINGNYYSGCVEQDLDGRIWVSPNSSSTLSYVDNKSGLIHSLRMPQINKPISQLCCDDRGLLWIIMEKRIIIFNPHFRKIVAQINNSDIKQLFKGPQKNTLYGITTSNEITLINSVTRGTIGLPLFMSKNNIEKAGVTADRRIYFLTKDIRFYIYDKKTHSFNYRNIEGINNVYNITSIFVDRQSNIWIGTFEEGYKFIPLTTHLFDVDEALSNHFRNEFVTFLTGDGQNKMWIATRHKGLWEFDRQNGSVKMLLNLGLKSEVSAIECCFYDSQKRLWVATADAVYCYNVSHGASLIKKYDNLRSSRYITEDRQGNIWGICNGNGGIWKITGDIKTAMLRPFASSIAFSSNVTYFMQMRCNKYVFSIFGDNVYLVDSRGTVKPLFDKIEPSSSTFLKSVIYIFEDSKGILWLGTYGCGLMRYDILHHTKTIYTMENGLPSNDVLAITEDKTGHIWMSTSFGLSKIIGNGQFINYFTEDGLLGNQYHERSVYSSRGMLYFTGNHGITSFKPEMIYAMHGNIPLIIESLVTDNKKYIPCGNLSKKINLSYKENSFTISFLGFDYASAKNLRYSYMLEGYDKYWSIPSTSRMAKFTNVPDGTYKFKVRVCNNEGLWYCKTVSLKIVIPPAPWKTWWAILIYIIVTAGLVFLVLRFYINYTVDKEKIKLSANTLQKERELNQAKINFFENVSHEFRTPLGLIYAPYCELSKEKDFSDKEKFYMSLIGANIKRLMALVEQILNFSHLSSETLSLKVNITDIVSFIKEIMERFHGENKEKNIKTSFSTKYEQLLMLVDKDKLDKILSNLLSNAFKYTPVNGEIVVSMDVILCDDVQKTYNPDIKMIASKYVQISVKDDGVGVEESEIGNIFDRFYRSSNKNNTSVVGSGIGLYYIKCLTIKHKGFIKAERNIDKGMTFRFCLPLDTDVYEASEMTNEDVKGWADDISANTFEYTCDKSGGNSTAEDKPQLLIIEDEPNLQLFLGNLLQPYYSVQKAFDGKEGLNKAFDIIPDIILTDVMMPLMNGYELCNEVKSDIRTCHIPVIMLTAKSNISEQIEGMNTGADVYIPKPFNPDYLLSVIQGTLKNRERMQHQIVNSTPITNKKEEPVNNLSKMDRELLSKLDGVMESELSNSDLSIDYLASELNFSRSTFYRKIKTLTGISPNDYIRVYKVKRAAELIKSGDYTLSEIGDMTGFSTQSYFSAMFKKYYNMTPSEYKNNKSSN